MTKLALLTALGALALGTTASASAAAKQRVVVDRFSEPYEFAVDCSELGPYEFEVLVSGRQRVRVTDVIGADGTLLQTIFDIGLSETDTNSVTGASMTLTGAVHHVQDFVSNTRTLSGKVWSGRDAGGLLFHDVGRIEMTLDTDEVLSVAGPHDVFFGGGDVDLLACDELAG